ncbi:MAG TPA: HNH endonuclease signature motif containing protein [Polyangiaceae bacterium]|nr:HNH endonuclease signature motif containing protein [Polyangiaceae bacterium]
MRLGSWQSTAQSVVLARSAALPGRHRGVTAASVKFTQTQAIGVDAFASVRAHHFAAGHLGYSLLTPRDHTSADLDRMVFELIRRAVRGSAGRRGAAEIGVYARMMSLPEFWQLDHLADAQLLEGLRAALHTKRRALAEVVAHLGEVEERRLHLLAAHASMFDYCVSRLNMSEDEACRRIELARLARRFPSLFSLLATGEISLSVALLLKPVLTDANQLELLGAAKGLSMRQIREVLATRFPSPDAPSNIRKLPQRAPTPEPTRNDPPTEQQHAPPPPNHAPQSTPTGPSAGPPLLFAPAPPRQSRIDPLSAERYRIQFTADAALKKKLELARDLLLHTHPAGDFAPVVSRALDLLITDLQRRRFGAGARAKQPKARPASLAREVPHAERRTVLERDGLACSWVNADGTRCASRAWLELDHRHPRAKGGSSEAHNLRMLCSLCRVRHNEHYAEFGFMPRTAARVLWASWEAFSYAA